MQMAEIALLRDREERRRFGLRRNKAIQYRTDRWLRRSDSCPGPTWGPERRWNSDAPASVPASIYTEPGASWKELHKGLPSSMTAIE